VRRPLAAGLAAPFEHAVTRIVIANAVASRAMVPDFVIYLVSVWRSSEMWKWVG